mmetsp:Transcript_43242/g.65344  ORF Transcript_43242/g.65344 Transcript_43242/m.65344 type:complete len:171 (-) Transcript_43242:1384-1896(-)
MCVMRVCMFFLNLLRFSIYIFLSDFRSSFIYLIVVSIKRGKESTCESAFSSFLLLFQRKIEKRVILSFDTQKGFGYNCFSLSPPFHGEENVSIVTKGNCAIFQLRSIYICDFPLPCWLACLPPPETFHSSLVCMCEYHHIPLCNIAQKERRREKKRENTHTLRERAKTSQ